MTIYKPYAVELYLKNKTFNTSYKVKKASLEEANKDVKVKELNHYSDPVVSLGYFHRESFEDYIKYWNCLRFTNTRNTRFNE